MRHVKTPQPRASLDKVAQRPERGWPAWVPAVSPEAPVEGLCTVGMLVGLGEKG